MENSLNEVKNFGSVFFKYILAVNFEYFLIVIFQIFLVINFQIFLERYFSKKKLGVNFNLLLLNFLFIFCTSDHIYARSWRFKELKV